MRALAPKSRHRPILTGVFCAVFCAVTLPVVTPPARGEPARDVRVDTLSPVDADVWDLVVAARTFYDEDRAIELLRATIDAFDDGRRANDSDLATVLFALSGFSSLPAAEAQGLHGRALQLLRDDLATDPPETMRGDPRASRLLEALLFSGAFLFLRDEVKLANAREALMMAPDILAPTGDDADARYESGQILILFTEVRRVLEHGHAAEARQAAQAILDLYTEQLGDAHPLSMTVLFEHAWMLERHDPDTALALLQSYFERVFQTDMAISYEAEQAGFVYTQLLWGQGREEDALAHMLAMAQHHLEAMDEDSELDQAIAARLIRDIAAEDREHPALPELRRRAGLE